MIKCFVKQAMRLLWEVLSVTEIDTNYNSITNTVGGTKIPRRIFLVIWYWFYFNSHHKHIYYHVSILYTHMYLMIYIVEADYWLTYHHVWSSVGKINLVTTQLRDYQGRGMQVLLVRQWDKALASKLLLSLINLIMLEVRDGRSNGRKRLNHGGSLQGTHCQRRPRGAPASSCWREQDSLTQPAAVKTNRPLFFEEKGKVYHRYCVNSW